jgi:hypothetical protein
MKGFSFFLLVSLLIGASGCVTTNVDLTEPEASYQATTKVELLFEEPSRPYKVIALIEGNGSPHRKQSLVFDKILKRAKKIGAQAIIPIDSNIRYHPKSTFNDEPVNSVGELIPKLLGGAGGGYDFDLEVKAIRFIDSVEKVEDGRL